jgi:hypothetical protein
MLNFYSAASEAVNSKTAMTSCIETALQEKDFTQCAMVIFYTTMGHNFKELMATAKSLCPQAEIVGCTGGGIISRGLVSEKIRALGIVAVTGKPNDYAIAFHDSIQGENSFEVSASVAKDLQSRNSEINMINIMTSGIDIAADKILKGIESVFEKEIPIFGGTSGDAMKVKHSFQFIGDTILDRGIILIGFADPTLKAIAGAHHGSVPIGLPFEVTRSQANRIIELDSQPAWPYLMTKLGLPEDATMEQTLPVATLAQEIPTELSEEYDNQHVLHTIFKVDEDKRTFYLPVDCAEGTKLWLVERDEELMFGGLDRMVNRLMGNLNGQSPLAVFHTDCMARGRFTLNQILKDEIIEMMQKPFVGEAKLPWLGIYGFGEFTPIGGQNCFHTQTSSLTVLVRNS